MNLPTQYQWLTKQRGLPNTIREGLKLYGTQEVIGRGSCKTIMSWRDELNQNGVRVSGFTDDSIPWCGLFAAIVAYRRLKKPEEVVKDPLWARNWAKYGVKSPLPSLGDVLVFSRGSGGHVGFYIGEDSSCYHVLGGNQSDAVTITRIQKARMLACRRPPYNITPSGCKPVRLASTGTVSKNEA
jgi:uncharacterized protein (TIGR02594 family)